VEYEKQIELIKSKAEKVLGLDYSSKGIYVDNESNSPSTLDFIVRLKKSLRNHWTNGDSLIIILAIAGTSQKAPASSSGGSTSQRNPYYSEADMIFYTIKPSCLFRI